MKLHSARSDVDYFGTNATKAFQIKASGKAFQILSSGLYKDKILAIVRELSCNARDAHVAAGTEDRPFDVHLPTALEPFFSIRDYGIGLSDTALTTLYTTYFESTKTESNDFIGALGLGSKSPFSYIDSFTVTSYFNGEKRTYTAFVDEDGLPNIVQMGVAETTDEHNGLEVSMPVKREDMGTFASKARQVYRYFNPIPNILGVPDFQPNYGESVYEGDRFTLTRVDQYGDSGIFAVMGPVAYPISIGSLRSFSAFKSDFLESMSNYGGIRVDIHFGMGEVDFTAGREELSYDHKVTVPNVCKRIREVEAALIRAVEDDFKDCKTRYEAVIKYDSMRRNGFGQVFSRVPVMWKGKQINSTDLVVSPLQFKARVEHFKVESDRYNNFKVKGSDSGVFCYTDKTIIDDIGNARKLRALLRENFKNKGVNVIGGNDDEDIEKLLAHLDGVPVTYASELPTAPRAPRVHRKAQIYYAPYGSIERNELRVCDLTEVDEDDDAHYVIVKHDLVVGLDADRKTFEKIVKSAQNAGIIKSVAVYVVPSTIARKLEKEGVLGEWTDLVEVIKEGLTKALKEPSLLEELSLRNASNLAYDRMTALFCRIQEYHKGALFAAFVDEKRKITRSTGRGTAVANLASFLQREKEIPEDKPKIEEYRAAIVERYPLLEVFNYNAFDNNKTRILQYLGQMDELYQLRNASASVSV